MKSFSWNTLSKQEKLIATIAIAALSLAFLDRLVLRLVLQKTSTMEENIRSKELLLKKNLKVMAKKEYIKAQERQFSDYAVEARSQEEEISSILREIERLAAQAQVKVSDTKALDLKSEKIYKKYSISLNCEATMEQLVNFMYFMEDSKVFFIIESFSVNSKDKEKGLVKATMNISKIVIP